MSQPSNTSVGERVTFQQLFERHAIVEIPIIQRDYAQGRVSKLESEIRTEFVRALHAALSKPAADPSLPLDLDFVYGSLETTGQQAFCPLDGQQRLTTLFLLHWYLAWKDGKFADFGAFVKSDQKSRFSYTVRPSSHEFFDSLLAWAPSAPPPTGQRISIAIADQPWFYRSWRLDPTIQACLTMLDAIHSAFGHTEGFYDRLVRADRPYVTFQLLDLRSFGLSDDLYIKMNARGKALTPFETFKARLEQHLGVLFPTEKRMLHGAQVSIKDYVSHRIDTVWADVFWLYGDPKTHLFDDRLMHLIRTLAVVTRNPDSTDFDQLVQALTTAGVSFSFGDYERRGCLDRSLVDTLIAVLDSWCGGMGGIRKHLPDAAYYDETAAFERAIMDSTALSYTELILLWAYFAYIREYGDNLQPDSFAEWVRVIRNLAVNTPYDGLDEFRRSLRSVNDLLKESNRILQFLASPGADVRGFTEQQIREEKLKAQLILKGDRWGEAIRRAEQHGYFKGQIEFLFKFSGTLDAWLARNACNWSETDDANYLQSFQEYYEKASAVFPAQGLAEFGDARWERALLALGDYLLPKRSNLSFLNDGDRDASWKRLLRGGGAVESKRAYVKDLLDRIDLSVGVKKSLDAVIQDACPKDLWRRRLVERGEPIQYCSNRMIRWKSEDRVYLLRKMQMNGEHTELFTYGLYLDLLLPKQGKGELAPFSSPLHMPVTGEWREPWLCLETKCGVDQIVLAVTSQKGGYELQLSNRTRSLPLELQSAAMTEWAWRAVQDVRMYLTVERSRIEAAIDTVVERVRFLAHKTVT